VQVSGVQLAGDTQTPADAPVPHSLPAGQAPQSRVLPQPSPILPQYWPLAGVQVRAVQLPGATPQIPVRPAPPQVCVPAQAPQSRVLPQPSPILPQYWPPVGVQVNAVHDPAGAPHTLGMPAPPQLWPAGQAPQSRVLPQPSPILPQYWPPAPVHVIGVQVAGLGAQRPGVFAPQI
jgi:hypothetical protein